jgi:hypothetical protein
LQKKKREKKESPYISRRYYKPKGNGINTWVTNAE